MKVLQDCRKRHNENQHDLYPSPHILQVIKPWKIGWVKHVAHMAERNMHLKDKDYLEDNTKVNLKETEWESVDRINLARDKGTWQSVVNIVIQTSRAI
jgi:hypothetical protein